MERCDGERTGYHLQCNGTLHRCERSNVGCGPTGKREMLAPEAVGYRRTLMQDA